MMKKLAITVAVGATFGMGAAQADNLQIEPLNPFLTFNIPETGGMRATGLYDITNPDAAPGAPGSFLAFCIELLEVVKAEAVAGTLDFTAVDLDNYTTTPIGGGNDTIQALFDERFGALSQSSLIDMSAFQLAIWAITANNTALSGWTAGGTNSVQENEALDDARGLLTGLVDSDPGFDVYDLTAWVHSDTPGADDGSQDMLQFALNNNGTVPEPGSLLLGLAGLAGLGFARRMR